MVTWRSRRPMRPFPACTMSLRAACSPSVTSITGGRTCCGREAPGSGRSWSRARPREWPARAASRSRATHSSRTWPLGRQGVPLRARPPLGRRDGGVARALGPGRRSVDGVHPPLPMAGALVGRPPETASRFPAPADEVQGSGLGGRDLLRGAGGVRAGARVPCGRPRSGSGRARGCTRRIRRRLGVPRASSLCRTSSREQAVTPKALEHLARRA